MQKVLEKKELYTFLTKLMKSYDLIAPVKDDVLKFEKIYDIKKIDLKENTLISPKPFFFPENEILFKVKNNKIIQPSKIKQRIIFGVRKCDLNALSRLDLYFLGDPYYKDKRDKTILIGFNCNKPGKYCFCNSMNLKDHYDLFFYEHKKHYYISIGSKKGLSLVKNLKTAKKQFTPIIKNKKSLDNKDLAKHYYNEAWQTLVDKCLSCSACTILCPTCPCFEIYDKLDINLKDSSRLKTLASCQLKSFTQVAGGKSFRDARLDRYKHFVYHKVVYFKEKFNEYMCTGCGRCIEGCPVRIDWVELSNLLK